MPRKPKKVEEPLHPIFETCPWRKGSSQLTVEQKIQLCNECYAQLTETTDYCEHIRKYSIPALLSQKA